MMFSILFQSAGNGSPEDRERVRHGLVEILRIPAATVEQMLAQAPVTIRTGLSEENAKSYARALESIGAVVRIVPTGSSGETPAPIAPEPDWLDHLKVYSPAFLPESGSRTVMTAATGQCNGDSLVLGHPLLSSAKLTDIRLISVFRTEDNRWFVDLYCRNQTRPIRIDSEVIGFVSFGIAASTGRPEALSGLIQFIHQKSRKTAVDLATFRFLKNPAAVRTFPNTRAMEGYLARLTADILTPEAAFSTSVCVSGKTAEVLLANPDPWLQPLPPPAAFIPPPMQNPMSAAPPVQYPAYPPPGYAQSSPPVGMYVAPPLPQAPATENYWAISRAGTGMIPRICVWLLIFAQGGFLFYEILFPPRNTNLVGLLLCRLAMIGLYLTTNFMINREDTRAVIFFICGFFFEITIFSLGGGLATMLLGIALGFPVFFWTRQELSS